MSGEQGTRYRFGPRERGGALAGWRAGQIVTVAVGLVFAVLVLRVGPDAVGVAVAIGVLIIFGALATVPVAGRTGDEWLPVTVCWGARRSRSLLGVADGPASGRMGALRSLRLLQAGWQDMGVVHDRAARTLTAALALRGSSFALLGADEQDRRVGAWASVLASLAREGSPVHRLQWVAASFPDDGKGVHHYLAEHAAPDAGSAGTASYEALLADMDSHTCAHDVVLALQVRLTKSVEAGCAVLARELASLVRQLADADVQVDGLLTAEQLAAQLLRTYEPDGVAVPGSLLADPWPMAMQETWSTVRVDGMLHATYWVAEWPRLEVRSDFLAPVLLGSSRSAFAVVMQPLGPDAAVRKVEASRTADLADAELRRRGGFMSTARHTRESEVLARREAELAEGHASFRYSGYVTVSAPSEEELTTACDAVQHAAGQSRLSLRRLYGDQAAAYTCTLPLARGLR
ncbi:MAG TPA: SCO6880 family protein [Acidimicrobiales bacterium]|nr:SCO6880 family protein [Acidimicrobiales bacterium]